MTNTSAPNIVLVMADQHRGDMMGCAGDARVMTPNLDTLASSGLRFSRVSCQGPLCMPARASFASGRYPHNHGMWKNEGELSEAEETFFQVLQKAGYCTAQVGKTHFYEHAEGVDLRQREA